MHTAIEVLHVLIGLLVTWAFAGFAAWSYPLGRSEVWLVSYMVMIALVALGARPVLMAFRRDKGRCR